MAWWIDDYSCLNKECEHYAMKLEVMHKRGTPPLCETCNSDMKKEITGIKEKDISWSLWSV